MTYGDHYQKQALDTASPAQLVLMMYDRALRALATVRGAEPPGDTELINRELQRAQALIAELELALDFERGQPIAGQLAELYTFCQQRLITANVRKDVAIVDEVVPVLAGLRDAWQQACVGADALVSG